MLSIDTKHPRLEDTQQNKCSGDQIKCVFSYHAEREFRQECFMKEAASWKGSRDRLILLQPRTRVPAAEEASLSHSSVVSLKAATCSS